MSATSLDSSGTLARSALYKLLSLAFLPPRDRSVGPFSELGRIAAALPEDHREALGPLLALPLPDAPPEREYTRLFDVGLAATPYETEYDPLASARKGHRLADVAGFYEAFGVRLAADRGEFPDHIAVELEFMALLLLKTARAEAEGLAEARAVCEEAARKFLAEHLGTWAGLFAERVAMATADPFYRGAARLLKAFLDAECRFLGVEPLSLPARPLLDPGPPTCPFSAECSQARGPAEPSRSEA